MTERMCQSTSHPDSPGQNVGHLVAHRLDLPPDAFLLLAAVAVGLGHMQLLSSSHPGEQDTMIVGSTSNSSRIRLGKSDRPFSERILEAISRGPYFWTVLALIAVLSVAYITTQHGPASSLSAGGAEEYDDHHFFKAADRGSNTQGAMQRCIDSDDNPEEWKSALNKQRCYCSDPTVATKRSDQPGWEVHQKRLVAAANHAAAVHGNNNLDLVLLGDSIVERFNGTRGLGRGLLPENRAIFERYFTRQGGGTLNAIALGSAGDTSNELLWRMENGMIPDNLNPKVWLMMVGTNDMGRQGCSKRMALSGMLHVAQYLRKRKPGSKIIVHGLLPRSDKMVKEQFGLEADYSLGYLWKNILFLNRELKRFCNIHRDWTYMEASRLFLEKQERKHVNHDTKGALQINANMMEDALHPSVEGYEAWAKAIVDFVKKELEKGKKKKKKKEKKNDG